MSKTYLGQMTKARTLVNGLKKNAGWAQSHGIRMEDLSALESLIEEGERLNAEVDTLRNKTHEVATQANEKLEAVKEKMYAMKREVKLNVDITQWPDYGVMDKR